MKYPSDGCGIFRTLDPEELRAIGESMAGMLSLTVNIVRISDDSVERGASWTCAHTIFWNASGDVRHEYMHILQRSFPDVFDGIYRQQGFVHLDVRETTNLCRMHDGILNPDTYYPDRPDYGYRDCATGEILVCFYDKDLETVTVGRGTGIILPRPIIVLFLGRPMPLDHPHEMMADFFVHALGSCHWDFLFLLCSKRLLMDTPPIAPPAVPDARICICTDPQTQKKTVTITPLSEDTLGPPSPNCVCALTHTLDHTLFYSCQPQHVQSITTADKNRIIWSVLWPPLFFGGVVLGISLSVWTVRNVRWTRPRPTQK